MLASATGLRRWVPLVNLDQGASVPLGFVFQLANELTPTHVTDGFCQAVVFEHILDGQTLHADDLVFAHHACTELVLVVSSAVIDLSVNASGFETGFVPVLRSLLFLSMSTLGFCQALLILGKVAGITDALSSGESHHRFDTQIKPDHLWRHGKRLDIFFNQDRNARSGWHHPW